MPVLGALCHSPPGDVTFYYCMNMNTISILNNMA